jgi:hypothetical protein
MQGVRKRSEKRSIEIFFLQCGLQVREEFFGGWMSFTFGKTLIYLCLHGDGLH